MKTTVLEVFLSSDFISLEEITCAKIVFHSGKLGTLIWQGSKKKLEGEGNAISVYYKIDPPEGLPIAFKTGDDPKDFLSSIDIMTEAGRLAQQEGMDMYVYSEKFIFLLITSPYDGYSSRWISILPR